MNYERSSSREKWTIMMYMRDFDLMTTYAYALRASNELSEDNIDDILANMEDKGIYRPRNGGSTFTGQFKSIQIAWYMFGYYKKNRRQDEIKKMVFTPLGNLLLDNLNDREKVRKIFMTMLFGNGFRQPFSQMSEKFNLYPFRLIFKLLRDPRLEYKLYNDEVFYYVMFVKTVSESDYEELVRDILKLRQRNPYEKLDEFKQNERVIGLACHEWRYATGMFESAGIVFVKNDHNDRVIGQLTYGNISASTGRPNAIRSYTEDYIQLRAELIPYLDRLLDNYPYYDKPYPEDELTTQLYNDLLVEMYSFYPSELLQELGIITGPNQVIDGMLKKATEINYYSHQETDGGVNFEYALRDAFNLFEDVEAERIGGSDNVDVECLYLLPSPNKKFDIEAKARKFKLIEINSSRLRRHRRRVGSKYTIIVTPNFVPGVLNDIENERTVIIKSATLANYFYQSILKNGRSFSYSCLDAIVEENMGKDITNLVNDYIYNNFGHSARDLSIRRSS